MAICHTNRRFVTYGWKTGHLGITERDSVVISLLDRETHTVTVASREISEIGIMGFERKRD